MAQKHTNGLRVEPITDHSDIHLGFLCCANAFGAQTSDAMWMAMNPGWNTASGAKACSDQMVKGWRSTTYNKAGDPNNVFIKATLPVPDAHASDTANRIVVGFAIWVQWSFVEGMGNPPSTDIAAMIPNLEELYAGDETTQQFLRQGWAAFTKQRVAVLGEKATTDSPATFSLDLLAVDPKFQRRGVASRLVEWGLAEARRRGNLESTTEGSATGRLVYVNLGYKPVGEPTYEDMDPELARRMPSNIFMRTGAST